MAVLPIRVAPAPILRQKSKRVKAVDGSIKKLVTDMIETLHANPARVGLAAPQVGVPLRVIVIGIPEEKDIALINPEIVRHSIETNLDNEGCLSIPGYMGEVERYDTITVKGLNRHGQPLKIKANGWMARIIQHEIDHLEGVLFIDRATKVWKLEEVEEERVVPEATSTALD